MSVLRKVLRMYYTSDLFKHVFKHLFKLFKTFQNKYEKLRQYFLQSRATILLQSGQILPQSES